MRILTLILILSTLLFGYNYNSVLLKAQASIFPKIILLDKKLKDKLIDGKIIYTIVYNENDLQTALDINKYIDENHNGYFDKYKYIIKLVKFSDFTIDTKTTAIYALKSENNIYKIANIAKKKGVVAFSYDIENLKRGLLFSLMIEKSTILYLNKDNLYTQKVDFVDSLLQMVKFIDKDNS